jgi:hypothetical protein
MNALNKEEILNNTDESLFSSLQDLAGGKGFREQGVLELV